MNEWSTTLAKVHNLYNIFDMAWHYVLQLDRNRNTKKTTAATCCNNICLILALIWMFVCQWNITMLPTEAVESIHSLRGQVVQEIHIWPGTGLTNGFCYHLVTRYRLASGPQTFHSIRHVWSSRHVYHVSSTANMSKNKSIRRHYSSPRFGLGIHTTADDGERRTSVNGNIANLTR